MPFLNVVFIIGVDFEVLQVKSAHVFTVDRYKWAD
jgi:hypothetical protein